MEYRMTQFYKKYLIILTKLTNVQTVLNTIYFFLNNQTHEYFQNNGRSIDH